MWQQIVLAGLDVGCVREHVYVPGRRFRADFAWPDQHLLLEVQGGVFAGKSGHSGIAGILKDCDRANAAAIAGWRVLRVTAAHIRTGVALRVLRAALGETQ